MLLSVSDHMVNKPRTDDLVVSRKVFYCKYDEENKTKQRHLYWLEQREKQTSHGQSYSAEEGVYLEARK